MYYIFFIHFSVDGHLNCFHALAIVNSAAVSIRVYTSFQITVFSDICAEMKLLGHMVKLQYFGHQMQRADSLKRP